MIAGGSSCAAMIAGAFLVLPWAFGNNSTRSWRAAGWGMILLAAGLAALTIVGLTTTLGDR